MAEILYLRPPINLDRLRATVLGLNVPDIGLTVAGALQHYLWVYANLDSIRATPEYAAARNRAYAVTRGLNEVGVYLLHAEPYQGLDVAAYLIISSLQDFFKAYPQMRPHADELRYLTFG